MNAKTFLKVAKIVAFFIITVFLFATVIGFASGFSQISTPTTKDSIITATEVVKGVVTERNVDLSNPEINLIYEDDFILIYEDAKFGARIVVSKISGVATYCPCTSGVCDEPIAESLQLVPSGIITTTVTLTPTLATSTPMPDTVFTPRPATSTVTLPPPWTATPGSTPTIVVTIPPTGTPTVEPTSTPGITPSATSTPVPTATEEVRLPICHHGIGSDHWVEIDPNDHSYGAHLGHHGDFFVDAQHPCPPSP